jgi:opacity protein-like surface antigen
MKSGGFRFLVLLLSMLAVSAPSRAAQWYLRGGAGYEGSLDADFHDEDPGAVDPPALFGQGPGSDGRDLGAYGDFGSFPVFELAAGAQPLSWLRTDLSLTYRQEADYTARANFINVPGEQPVSAEAESWTAMANFFLELTELFHLDLGAFKPYVGGGVGVSYNEIGRMTYRFPGLTRHKLSVTPSGSRMDFAFMVTGGTGFRLSKKLLLDVSYRYSDLGKMETDSGNMFMDFLPGGIDIAETSAPFRTHGFLAGFRYLF